MRVEKRSYINRRGSARITISIYRTRIGIRSMVETIRDGEKHRVHTTVGTAIAMAKRYQREYGVSLSSKTVIAPELERGVTL